MTKQVLQNYERLGLKAAWTGPLARGDYEVVAKHMAALQEYSPEYCKAYDALNRLAERILPQDGEDGAELGCVPAGAVQAAHNGAHSPAVNAAPHANRSKELRVLTGGKG
jgi:hypothetical protein